MIISCNKEVEGLKNGDIIFQFSLASHGKIMQQATGSKYSHMGIVYLKKNKPYVYEAGEKVNLTPFSSFIKKGEGMHYVIKRLYGADSILTAENLQKMKKEGDLFRGKANDGLFAWSDKRLYCSELVWKIYSRALDIQIGELDELKSFDLSELKVEKDIRQRYQGNLTPQEPVISPGEMFDSPLLETVMIAPYKKLD